MKMSETETKPGHLLADIKYPRRKECNKDNWFQELKIMGVSLFWSEFLSVWLFISKTVLFCFVFNKMRVLDAGTLLSHPYWTNLCGQRPAMLFEVRLKYKWFY